MWFVYMARCKDGTLYTGVTTDLKRRLKEHNTGKLGAKYTKSKRPILLVYMEKSTNRSTAQSREYVLRKLTKKEKEQLINIDER